MPKVRRTLGGCFPGAVGCSLSPCVMRQHEEAATKAKRPILRFLGASSSSRVRGSSYLNCGPALAARSRASFAIWRPPPARTTSFYVGRFHEPWNFLALCALIWPFYAPAAQINDASTTAVSLGGQRARKMFQPDRSSLGVPAAAPAAQPRPALKSKRLQSLLCRRLTVKICARRRASERAHCD